jgi:Golgi phosphoprotein 3
MTSLTQRTSGIIQRRRTGAEGGTNNDHDENAPVEDVDEDEHDSKETRLTLMEEILLLGLKDREVVYFSKID